MTIHLTKPDPDLFAQLTLPAAYPVPPGTRVHLPARTVPGTGPYEISSYSPDLSNNPQAHGQLVLTRNPYFRQWSAAAQPAGFPNRIVVRTNYSQAQQVTAVEQGRADMTWDPPPPSDLTALSQSFPSQLHQDPVRQTSYVWLDVRSAPFDNLLARQAFNYAVDRGGSGSWGSRSTEPAGARPASYSRRTSRATSPTARTPRIRRRRDGGWPQTWPRRRRSCINREHSATRSRCLHAPPMVTGTRTSCGDSEPDLAHRVRTEEMSDNKYWGQPPRFYTRFQAGVGVWGAGYVWPARPSSCRSSSVRTSRSGAPMNMGGFAIRRSTGASATALSNDESGRASQPGSQGRRWIARWPTARPSSRSPTVWLGTSSRARQRL